jgi:hypothetical protein
LEIAITDVPGQPSHYSLLINGRKQDEFVEWPASWTTEPDSGVLAVQREEYEYEMEKRRKNKDVLPIEEEELDEDDPGLR